MNIIKVGVVIISVVFIIISEATVTEDYCWRDYDGKIPSDALSAGMDKDGKPVYIGQALHEAKIIAGKIKAGDNQIYYEYLSAQHARNENVKILCSSNSKKFKWIQTRHSDVQSLSQNKILIKGGFEDKCSMYIGRLEIDDTLNVGKVMCCPQCHGLFTAYEGRGRLDEVFQILSYNEKNNNNDNDILPNVNVRDNFTAIQSNDRKTCKHISITLYT